MTISELITKLAISQSTQIAHEIEIVFPDMVFGLLIQGLPRGEHGSEYAIGAKDNVTMTCVVDPNGKRMLKACADPSVFDKN
jgi:hypothetical protein